MGLLALEGALGARLLVHRIFTEFFMSHQEFRQESGSVSGAAASIVGIVDNSQVPNLEFLDQGSGEI